MSDLKEKLADLSNEDLIKVAKELQQPTIAPDALTRQLVNGEEWLGKFTVSIINMNALLAAELSKRLEELIKIDSIIGLEMYPIDNSYSLDIVKNERPETLLAGSYTSSAKKVKITTEPYTLQVGFLGNIHTHEFVTVEYEGKLYRVLNNFTSKPEFASYCYFD